MSHAKETGTRKGWSGEDDIIARFGSKHEYFLASDPSYPKLVASYGILGRSEQYTSRKMSYARPALALFWQFVLQPTGGIRGIQTLTTCMRVLFLSVLLWTTLPSGIDTVRLSRNLSRTIVYIRLVEYCGLKTRLHAEQSIDLSHRYSRLQGTF